MALQFFLLFVCASFSLAQEQEGFHKNLRSHDDVSMKSRFDAYLAEFKIEITDDYNYRLGVFGDSLSKIARLNKEAAGQRGNVVFGLNNFAHLTTQEWLQYLGKDVSVKKSLESKERDDADADADADAIAGFAAAPTHDWPLPESRSLQTSLPSSVDWRHKMTPVKSQVCFPLWSTHYLHTHKSLTHIHNSHTG